MEEVERFFRHLVDVLSAEDPERLREPLEVAQLYQSVVPYRHHRAALGFDTSGDYEMVLLRFLAGEGGFVSLDPPEAQDALAQEAAEVNPNPGAFREYAAAQVFLNQGAVRTVTEAHEAYAPPEPFGVPPTEPELPFLASEPEPAIPPTRPASPAVSVPDEPDLPATRIEPVSPDLEPLAIERDPTPPSPSPFDRGEGCVYCGTTFPAARTVNFCPECGRDQRHPTCPGCDTDLDAGWRYCITCGRDVRSA